jgi:hypothetical protein
MSNVLASNLALETYSQVVNGLPVPRPQEEPGGNMWWIEDNPEPNPSQEAYDIVKGFRDNFRVEVVYIDANVKVLSNS